MLRAQPQKWPASSRNGGRHQIGMVAGFASKYMAGINRYLQPSRGLSIELDGSVVHDPALESCILCDSNLYRGCTGKLVLIDDKVR